MNPFLALVLYWLVAMAILAGGYVLGRAVERANGTEERLKRTHEIEQLTEQYKSEHAESRYWKGQAITWQEEAHRFKEIARQTLIKGTVISGGEITGDALEDPPTVSQADRRAMTARRAREERQDRHEMDRRPIGVRDPEAAPVPQLRDADDDH